MQAKSTWTLGPDVRIMAVEREGDRWVISADAQEIGSCSRMRSAIATAAQSIFALFTGPAGARSGRRIKGPDDVLALSEQVVRTKDIFRSTSRRRGPTCASDITR
jgi:hypothetical protein